MFLKSLTLINFRNYSSLKYEFDNPITVIVGDNAKGKSNFLESIFFLATTKSERTQQDEEFIKIGENVLRVKGRVQSEKNEEIDLEVILQSVSSINKLSKKVKVNGIPRRVSDYTGNFVAIFFSPEDINLVMGSPSLRRHHINLILSQIDKNYKKTLDSYENIIIRKNKILKNIKEGSSKLEELDFWINQQLVFGESLSKKRRDFFKFINEFNNKKNNFSFEYIESFLNEERLREYKEKEIQASLSLIGPHRDDFIFQLNNQDLSAFGSRGEQRTAVLFLKLSEINFIENQINKRPILLLDDIFSELDENHRKLVIDIAKMQQTIISTIELDLSLTNKLKDAKIIEVESFFGS